MARTTEELEAYLQKLERRFERLDEGTYLIAGAPNQPPIALRVAPPVIVLQVPIGPAPEGESPPVARLFRRLLELNGNDLLHASYSLEGKQIVLGAALELDNLDLNEIEAVLADVDIALAEHVPALREMVQDKG
jgi:Tir chaperone family protein CesT